MAETYGVKKIVMAKLGIKTEETKERAEKGESFVAHFLGTVTRADAEETQYGPYTDFKGIFEGTNSDGEVFGAKRLILPAGVAEDHVNSLVALAEGKPVNFSFELHAHPSEKGSAGYEYSIIDCLKSEMDPLAELRKTKKAAEAEPA